jgi:DNA-binding protein Fis
MSSPKTNCSSIPTPTAKNPSQQKNYLNHLDSRSLKDVVAEVEKDIIIHCLEKNHGNVAETVKQLDIGKTALYDKMKRYNISPEITKINRRSGTKFAEPNADGFHNGIALIYHKVIRRFSMVSCSAQLYTRKAHTPWPHPASHPFRHCPFWSETFTEMPHLSRRTVHPSRRPYRNLLHNPVLSAMRAVHPGA